MCACVCRYTYGDLTTPCLGWFFPFTMLVLEIEFMSSGLVASLFTYWAISLAQLASVLKGENAVILMVLRTPQKQIQSVTFKGTLFDIIMVMVFLFLRGPVEILCCFKALGWKQFLWLVREDSVLGESCSSRCCKQQLSCWPWIFYSSKEIFYSFQVGMTNSIYLAWMFFFPCLGRCRFPGSIHFTAAD